MIKKFTGFILLLFCSNCIANDEYIAGFDSSYFESRTVSGRLDTYTTVVNCIDYNVHGGKGKSARIAVEKQEKGGEVVFSVLELIEKENTGKNVFQLLDQTRSYVIPDGSDGTTRIINFDKNDTLKFKGNDYLAVSIKGDICISMYDCDGLSYQGFVYVNEGNYGIPETETVITTEWAQDKAVPMVEIFGQCNKKKKHRKRLKAFQP